MTEQIEVTRASGPIRVRVATSEPGALRIASVPVSVRVLGTPGPDGRPTRAEEQFSDYRKVNGIDVPFKASVLRDGQKILDRTIKSVTFNTAVDPMLFQQPL